jgi:membrane associated rhomboid family serine protease
MLVPNAPQHKGTLLRSHKLFRGELIIHLPIPIAALVQDDTDRLGVEVFRGSAAASLEFGLVLDAKGLGYERIEAEGAWILLVAPALGEVASDELRRYADERTRRREIPPPQRVFAGAGVGAAFYAWVVIATAYCAGIQLFGVDWLTAGAVDSGANRREWWRAITALTLHLDQEHLLGNLLFGIGAGILAGRMFGPGFAWLCILVTGAAANYVDMLISPVGHRAVGASTAVFSALGLLAGFGWGKRFDWRERRLYRWAPLFAGVCLLALLGAGNEHVDVLGHVLGFTTGIAAGVILALVGVRQTGGVIKQWFYGALAISGIGLAWFLALQHGRAT